MARRAKGKAKARKAPKARKARKARKSKEWTPEQKAKQKAARRKTIAIVSAGKTPVITAR